MIPLDYLSVARFRGPDAGDFLHRQLSADILALARGEAVFACCCTPKGQVIALLLVCRQGDDFLVAGAAGLLPLVLARLRMFVFRSRLEFQIEDGLKIFGAVASADSSLDGAFLPSGLDLCYRFLSQADAPEPGDGSFKVAEISRGVAWLSTETSEKFIPQMLGYEAIGAVSFSKGCYPGQEIVARARYLGKVKRKPVFVRVFETLDAPPGGQVELLRGDAWVQGVVIDSADSDGGTVVFIVAPIEPENDPEQLKYLETSYRCATM